MLPLPVLNFQRTPVVMVVTALAAALEVVCIFQQDMRITLYGHNRLGLLSPVWSGELWRPVTTALLHGDPLHALFNIYWLLVFGGTLETRLGSFRFLGLFLLLAYVSMMPQFLISNYDVSDVSNQHGVVGLSGVMYGLFGVLLVGRLREPALQEVCNSQTELLMGGWFIFCIVADRFGWMHVANFAHAFGVIFGLLYGGVIFDKRHRLRWLLAAVPLTLLVLVTLFYVPGHELYQQHRYNRSLGQAARSGRLENDDGLNTLHCKAGWRNWLSLLSPHENCHEVAALPQPGVAQRMPGSSVITNHQLQRSCTRQRRGVTPLA